MKVISTEKKPIKMWLNNVEDGALQQAKNLANLPFLFKWVCLMPDCHQGYGMPIGGVIATRNVVIPNAVGVDIGCGMRAARLSLTDIKIPTIKKILEGIRSVIPVGFNHQQAIQEWEGFEKTPQLKVVREQIDSAQYQLGTLGGGNHFIELQRDNNGFVWIMIHSGSRNFGYKIAKHFNKVAQKLCKRWHSNIPEFKGEDGLAFLPIETQEYKDYDKAMCYALKFAEQNRAVIMDRIIDVVQNEAVCQAFGAIDVHHNYARWENHFGQNVIVHRKGAISAKLNEAGIIPGSQGTSSYIVSGRGNPESFTSCSHGAGRKMGRNQARKELDLEQEQKLLDDQNIIHAVKSEVNLDEAVGAYKDIETVMKNQSDLVNIEITLKPIAVVKA